MAHYQRTHTKIAWQYQDGTYHHYQGGRGNWPTTTTRTRSPIDADDFHEYHHKATEDLQESMTCNPPKGSTGKWIKIEIKTTAKILD